MQKVILSIVGLILLLILAGTILPPIVDDTIADAYSEPFSVVTASNETSTTETLTYPHYYEDLTNLSATSDNGDDDPVVMSYDADTQDVTVAGLASSDSRILTIDYYYEGNQQFTGFSPFVKLLPFLFIIGGIVACLWGLYSAYKSRG